MDFWNYSISILSERPDHIYEQVTHLYMHKQLVPLNMYAWCLEFFFFKFWLATEIEEKTTGKSFIL